VNQIIFISGWGSDSSVWNPVLTPFVSNHRCDPVSWEECLSNELNNTSLFKLLSESNSSHILVGWSLGGMIALSAAIAFPEKVSGVVLISSSARMVQDKEYEGIRPRVLKAMRFRLKTDKQGLLNDFAAMGISPAKNDLVRKYFVDTALEINNDKLSEGLSYLQSFDLRNRLADVRIPVNIVHGECDGIMNLTNARYLEENLLNADLVIVDGAGHFLIHSNPEIIIESIKKLCRRALPAL
jgi:pimeloyl-[acyl-carrier protein] methyl ester esterase